MNKIFRSQCYQIKEYVPMVFSGTNPSSTITGKKWYINGVVDEENILSNHAVSANAIDTFKKKLIKFMDTECGWR